MSDDIFRQNIIVHSDREYAVTLLVKVSCVRVIILKKSGHEKISVK